MNESNPFEIVNMTHVWAGLMYPVLEFFTGGLTEHLKRNGKIESAQE